jgi:hypothetical protein
MRLGYEHSTSKNIMASRFFRKLQVKVNLYLNIKEKVKFSLCLTKHHVMKTYRGSGGIAPSILDLGTRWR